MPMPAVSQQTPRQEPHPLQDYQRRVEACLKDNLAEGVAWQSGLGALAGGYRGARDGAELGAIFDGVGALPGAVIGGVGGAAIGAAKGGGLGVLDTAGQCLVMPDGLKVFR